MSSSTSIFIEKINNVINSYSLLSHPFYEAWNKGELSIEILQNYAKQYYAHVKAFPTYVSAVHSHCDNLPVREMLLENLIEEERGTENHPELWMRFAESLGATRQEINSTELLPETKESVEVFKQLTQKANWAEGLAALYAYESQIPQIAQTKREGLQKFYGITDAAAVSFFKVHEAADVFHSASELKTLEEICETPFSQEKVINAALEAAKALWHFLDGIQNTYMKNLVNACHN